MYYLLVMMCTVSSTNIFFKENQKKCLALSPIHYQQSELTIATQNLPKLKINPNIKYK
jgi:hypothetical protein